MLSDLGVKMIASAIVIGSAAMSTPATKRVANRPLVERIRCPRFTDPPPRGTNPIARQSTPMRSRTRPFPTPRNGMTDRSASLMMPA